jgi:dihydroflavonol-4-reductase
MTQHKQLAVVLGATGFIGGHIARTALEAGWSVRGLRRSPGATGNLGAAPIEWISGNLDDSDTLVRAMQGAEVVFHAAAYYPSRGDRRSIDEQIRVGCEQTQRVLQAAQQVGIQRFIYTSTLTTIGNPPRHESRLANESDFYKPGSLAKSAYYEAKFAMEQVVLAAARQGFPGVILNPTAVFGPGDVHLTLGGLLLAAARGRAIAWLPATVNVVDVRDVAATHLKAIDRARIGERYILGGHNYPLKDAIEQITRIAKVHPPRFEIPFWLIDALVRLDDSLPFTNLTGNHLRAIRHWQGYDITKAREELAHSPRPFEQTLQDALIWFREQGLISAKI